MNKQYLLFVLLLLCILSFSGVAQADSRLQEGRHLTPHPAGCQPGEVYLSSQDWWINATGEERNPATGRLADDFGHIHTELCFPHLATVSGKITFQVKHVLHRNPGELRQFLVQIYNNGDVKRNPPLCHHDHAFFCVRYDPPRTLDNCEKTGGHYGDDRHTCVWWDSVTIDTREFPYDGWQQFRFRAFVREPDGEEARTSTGLHVKLDNDHTYRDAYPSHIDQIEARGWYGHEVNYTTTRLNDIPLRPLSGVWEPKVYLRPGVDGIPVTSHGVYVDANFHHDHQGWVIREGDGRYKGHVSIDTRRLENGWHRLVLKADALSQKRGSTNSSVMAVLFEVANDPPCDRDCWPAIGNSSASPNPAQPTMPTIRINFQEEDAWTPADYLADVGRPYGNRHGYKYGWSADMRYLARERHKAGDQRWDTLLHLPRWAKWEISLPDGVYDVTLGIGDPIYDKHYTIDVEGVSFWDDKYLDNWDFRTRTKEVTVHDGRLTLTGRDARDDRTQISFIIISPQPHYANVHQIGGEAFIPLITR